MEKNTLLSIVAVAVSGLALMFAFGAPESITNVVGGAAGPEHGVRQFFNAGFQSGGTTLATSSTATTYTLLQGEIDGDVTYISWTPNLNTTLTSMASTSMSFLGNNTGDTREYLFYNASTTAAATVTFAAGTGVDLQEDEGGSVIVNGLELSKLTFVRKADSDVLLLVEPYQVAD